MQVGGGQATVFHLLNAHIHSRLGGGGGGAGQAALYHLPGGLQQQALLRVHQLGLGARHAKQPRIKQIHASQEGAVAHPQL